MPSLFALIELFNEPIPDLPGVGLPLLDVLRAGMDNEPAERPSASRLRDELQRLGRRRARRRDHIGVRAASRGRRRHRELGRRHRRSCAVPTALPGRSRTPDLEQLSADIAATIVQAARVVLGGDA